MADSGPILVTGADGQLGAVGRTVTGLLLERGLPVRAMVRREDDRAAALRAVGRRGGGRRPTRTGCGSEHTSRPGTPLRPSRVVVSADGPGG
jgi:hypothetical protein